ncbi:hypothetical protein [Pengzhenrongella frigida]|uniref:Glycogen debranching protein n=1 Tax=Pengzhenrongella frigida TaxID=1259133 RepID=A0A4Q5N3W6_9MICO|nr:hypothetical protein [Cellulomonas sp. HLT2-17]RYV52938.1 hypothetical protein EUA98_00125 [Cellulomonas sp. HLT2-17]
MTARSHATARPRPHTRTVTAVGLAVAMLVPALATGADAAPAAPVGWATSDVGPAPDGQLTNLAHLDFLGDTVSPPALAGHTTYRLDTEPDLGVLWTYADRRDGGVYERVGGGPHDTATDTWAQGAFNTDDLARAAVVYLRHWKLDGDTHSRDAAYQLLRAVTYMQTTAGADAGNVALWMQPDGSLNLSPVPVELPDPSDSGESYWLARTVWALGEGYAAFAVDDPEFAAFLGDRIDLALTALERQSLSRYGTWDVADGARVPTWLIVDGADATGEAVLGLSAFVESAPASTLTTRAATAVARYAEGIAAMSSGDSTTWPYGAILPWTHSQSMWHAWSSQMPAALARAADAVGRPDLLDAAVTDVAGFTPYLLTATGPINGWMPSPSDTTQIAYGVDSRVQSLLAVADTTGRPGLAQLAGISASWYFGANRAGAPMYDPATGVTFDGLNGDGVVNQNSGAESTIHGLLTMLALDAHPDAAATARSATSLVDLNGVQVVEAESATLSGGAVTAPAPSAWTGESLWSAGSYLELATGARAAWTLPASDQPRVVQAVVDLHAATPTGTGAARLDWSTGRTSLGTVDPGTGGDQGVTEAPGALTPVSLPRELPAGATALSVAVRRGATTGARVDALLLKPRVSHLVLDGPHGGTALVQNAGSRTEAAKVALPGGGKATVRSYDATGTLRQERTMRGAVLTVQVRAGGFTVLTR